MWNIPEQEERDYQPSSESEWDRDEALHAGASHPESAWILTDRDVIHANPFYKGPPVPHPDDYGYEEEEYLGSLADLI